MTLDIGMSGYSQYFCYGCGDVTMNWDCEHLWPCPLCGNEGFFRRGGFFCGYTRSA